MRVAVIGGGVSGLVATHLVADSHEVSLFEAAANVGGHAHTVDVEENCVVHHIDTGFVVFNDRNYPLFRALLARLDVDEQPTSMSFSVSDESGAFELSTRSLNGIFANRRHLIDPRFFRIVADAFRCQRRARSLSPTTQFQTIGAWLDDGGYSDEFVRRVAVPLLSAIWSSDPVTMASAPPAFLARFFDNHGMLQVFGRPQWSTVVGGSKSYVDALVGRCAAKVRVGSPVHAVRRKADGIEVDVGGTTEHFDRAVLALHAPDALRVLCDASPAEREVLGGISFQDNEVVLHTDVRLLPRRRRAWASWNYHHLEPAHDRVTVTYDMTRLQRLATETRYCVTLNRTDAIDPSKIIQRFTYAHPVFDRVGLKAQMRVAEISGSNSVHYCGAYWGTGFHEDGVRSGDRVARELGCAGL